MLARLIYIFIAVVLALTASLKLQMLISNPFADIHSGYPYVLLVAVVLIEAGLSIAIFLSKNGPKFWCCAVLVFVTFTIIAGIRTVSGDVSCGCAGSVDLPPWVFLIFDLSCLCFLFFTPPKLAEIKNKFMELRGTCNTPFVWGGVSCAIICLASVWLGLALNQSSIEDVYYSDNFEVRKEQIISIKISNRSDFNASIFGSKKSCVCIALVERNFIIPARSTVSVKVWIRPPSKGKFHQRIGFFIKHPTQKVFQADIFGFVL